MCVGGGVNQLSVDADQVTGSPDTPFEHIADAQLTANLLRIDGFVPVRECGIARDHEHVFEPRQIGCQIFADPVCEILLVRVVAEVSKRQHDDRQTWRSDGLRD